jgi:hypothetical protein
MLCLVFDRPPGPEAPRFIEVEDGNGKSINAGRWRTRPDGLAELIIGEPAAEVYCDNCRRYRPTELGAWELEGEYEFADRICSVCCWIIAVLRRPAQA